jgi:hypothetical protein
MSELRLLATQNSTLIAALSLALFVFRVDANHPHHTFAVDDLALVANLLYRCPYLHNPAFSRQLSAFSKSNFFYTHCRRASPGRQPRAAVRT